MFILKLSHICHNFQIFDYYWVLRDWNEDYEQCLYGVNMIMSLVIMWGRRLKEHFNDNIISKNGQRNWPRRLWDLTPLDYHLWGYLKLLIYVDKPATIETLESNV